MQGDRLRGINQLRSLDPNDAFRLIQPLSQDENSRVRYAAVSQIASLRHVNLDQAHDLLRDRLLHDSEMDHHLADARQEILTAFCALAGLDPEILHQVWQAPTVEAALKFLATMAPQALPEILSHIANRIDERAISLQVGCALFGRDRQIVAISEAGNLILTRIRLY
ncbi:MULTISPECIES: HEAT repeat domain-containing protein [unclassified Thermosynechococcus]|uniref:HEAT repeat domain-containing protein n=1 Tax=unclassified Thermosynechococcus TaxID=2622553 RepID=UPI002673223A|nr:MULTISPECIES: HEAT repeat domain-containing protein [unclassified Thermosynechococcus]WKT82831.1 HEAT repeat domain-containing protein [Thermosynechococcus sp. HY596]WNC61958.1 HEAT repeat domain-containing protein [Thermosynechococcus sp. HY591]WNC64512.1 HEAT repeat domain-containing protein [Thermosynechococcus sp. HY593]